MGRLSPRVPALLLTIWLAAPAAAAPDRGDARDEARWTAIHEVSQRRLAALSQEVFGSDGSADALSRWTHPPADLTCCRSMIVVGFTGGLERRDSPVSGVVRMNRSVGEHFGETSRVTALAYNNFHWRQAAAAVRELARDARAAAPRHDMTRGPLGTSSASSRPILVVYGHSWGAGSIAKFARAVRDDDLDISLAMYIDAFTLRNPRLPDNIRYAVNFYQRTGILRGLPLRGKKKLIAQGPETVVLGSHRIRPETDHFGWNWNLVQPLLYRHHHRIGHDERLQRYLLEVIHLKLELLAAEQADDAMPRRRG